MIEQAGDMRSSFDKSLQLKEILVIEKKATKSKKRMPRRKKLEAFG